MGRALRRSQRRAAMEAAWLAAIGVAIGVAIPCTAAIIRVPGNHPTIQAGIDAASEGDIVLLAPGTYTGPGNVGLDINETHPNFVLMSKHGAAVTIIDCQGTSTGIWIDGGQGPSTVIQGLTIRNGDTWPGAGAPGRFFPYAGAGIYIVAGSAPTIRDCHIQDCRAYGEDVGFPLGIGGGLYCEGSVTLTGCTFSGNSAVSCGSAIFCWSPSVVTNCVFYGNRGSSAVAGSPTLTCCNIYGNPGGDWVGDIADQYGVNGNFSEDPLFCLENNPSEPYSLHGGSPCLPENSPCGQLVGAFGQGCEAVTSIESTSWGAIKALYR